jgi:hypothetical protein
MGHYFGLKKSSKSESVVTAVHLEGGPARQIQFSKDEFSLVFSGNFSASSYNAASILGQGACYTESRNWIRYAHARASAEQIPAASSMLMIADSVIVLLLPEDP